MPMHGPFLSLHWCSMAAARSWCCSLHVHTGKFHGVSCPNICMRPCSRRENSGLFDLRMPAAMSVPRRMNTNIQSPSSRIIVSKQVCSIGICTRLPSIKNWANIRSTSSTDASIVSGTNQEATHPFESNCLEAIWTLSTCM